MKAKQPPAATCDRFQYIHLEAKQNRCEGLSGSLSLHVVGDVRDLHHAAVPVHGAIVGVPWLEDAVRERVSKSLRGAGTYEVSSDGNVEDEEHGRVRDGSPRPLVT